MYTVASFTVPSRYACVGLVRNELTESLTDLPLTGDQLDVVRLSASEIVTNALAHGLGGEDASVALRVEAVADRERGVLRVIVLNPCRTRSALPAADRFGEGADLYAETGRGLQIVQSMVDAVGWELLAGDDGAVWCAVWFELAADLAQSPAPARVAELPRPLPVVGQSAPARRSLVRRAVDRLPGAAVEIGRRRRVSRAISGARAA
ncbi:ATP-binding protein [Kitasatospora griseola]|uniref:ATP-binding protein n=1 Tax=Kitasatospora griseola TaxID=2064 RepID=UPI00382D5497